MNHILLGLIMMVVRAQIPGQGGQTAPSIGEQMSYPDAKRRIEATLKSKPNDFSLRMAAAEFYMKSGDHASAIPHLQAAVHISPRVLPWIALGDAATFVGRFALAKQAYDSAAMIDPNNAYIIRGRGQLLEAQRKFQEARTVLEAGVKKYPDSANLRSALGNLYLVLKLPQRAAEILEPAVRSQPYRPDLH